MKLRFVCLILFIVAMRVMNRQNIEFDGLSLVVTSLPLASPPHIVLGPIDKHRLIFQNLPFRAHRYVLEGYLEDCACADVEDVMYSLKKGVAMVTFHSEPRMFTPIVFIILIIL